MRPWLPSAELPCKPFAESNAGLTAGVAILPSMAHTAHHCPSRGHSGERATNSTMTDTISQLEHQLAYRKKLLEIINKVHSTEPIGASLITVTEEITALFGCQRITLYVVDATTRELVTQYKSGDTLGSFRLPISPESLAGYTAYRYKVLNVKDAYDQEELHSYDPRLRFYTDWDKKSGFRTKQVLVVPVIFKQYLFGVLQFLNKTDDTPFTEQDVVAAKELSDIIGVVLHNKSTQRGQQPGRFDYLLANNLVTQQELEEAMLAARKRHCTIETVLMEQYEVPKAEIGRTLSQYYHTPFVEFDASVQRPSALLQELKVPFLKNNLWVPLGVEHDEILVVIDNPMDLRRKDLIGSLFPRQAIRYNVSLREDILKFVDHFFAPRDQIHNLDAIMEQLDVARTDEDRQDGDQLDESDSAVVQFVNRIILDAFERGASDIHIEPSPDRDDVIVRIRIDGDCQEYNRVPCKYRNAIVSRIKIMSNLDITERRKPQDGKIKFKKLLGRSIELRVATIPTQGDVEDVVMRILASGDPIPLGQLGLSTSNNQRLAECINKPYGIIFVCGPTGSGKTTTLHSVLRQLNRVETKIWTAEDPVEITQKGLRQVQVKHDIGFNFATAMRSFLRADPDIIMVGEMRDQETTKIGIEASLTGHLVLSTLHTNSAPESVTRLLDMGMDPFNFADAILCIMSQRLVKTLCKTCKEPYHPDKAEFDQLVLEYDPDQFAKNLALPYTEDLLLYRAKGCKQCSQSGYKGRLGIHELLVGTDEMKILIQRRSPVDEIRHLAVDQGMRTLKQDGIEKVFKGLCDMPQVRRVCIK